MTGLAFKISRIIFGGQHDGDTCPTELSLPQYYSTEQGSPESANPNRRYLKTRGWTIMDLLIVLALLGILLGIAIPGYQQYLTRAHRVEAIATLLVAASCQERIRAETGSYDATRCIGFQDEDYYQISIKPLKSSVEEGFVLIASPNRVLGHDPCGSMTLNHHGRRGISGNQEYLSRCWSGR